MEESYRFDREPNMNLLRALLSRSSVDMFTADCLKILIREPESASRVAELLASLMERAIHAGDLTPQSLVGKQKRPNQRWAVLAMCFTASFAVGWLFRSACEVNYVAQDPYIPRNLEKRRGRWDHIAFPNRELDSNSSASILVADIDHWRCST